MSNNLSILRTAAEIYGKVVIATITAAGQVLNETTPRTPYRKGELRQKRRVIPQPNGAQLQWTAKHAAAQNAGQARGRVFRRYTTSGTGKGFADIKGTEVVEKIARALK